MSRELPPPPEGILHPERVTEAQALIIELDPLRQMLVVSAMVGFLSQAVSEDEWRAALVNASQLIEALS